MTHDPEPAQGRPNVVLVCVDQWRGDCLSIDGHPDVRTPHLDQVASRGVRFGRAYSATPTCVPARTALMTGLSQESHGRVGYRDGVRFDYPVSLAGEFGRHGYHTQAIGKMHVSPERNRIGFDDVLLHDGYLHQSRRRERDYRMFDDYLPWLWERDPDGAEADYVDSGLDCNSFVSRPWDRREALHPTNWVVTEGIRWLYRRDPTRPFFLYLSFVSPHSPLHPPEWALRQYIDRDLEPPVVGDWDGYLEPFRQDQRLDALVAHPPPDVIHRAQAGYYGNITHVDMQIHRFLVALAEHGLADDTVVVFTSDHGDLLADHHLFRKGFGYEGSARVPLVLTGPSDLQLAAGTRRDEVVELRDVMPTLLDCARLPVPDGIDGRSLLPLARGHRSDWRDHLHGEHAWIGQSLHWVTDGRTKYCWFSGDGHEQLFDLDADPQERHDLAPEPSRAADLQRWRAVLVHELDGREEGFSDGSHLVPGRPPAAGFAVH